MEKLNNNLDRHLELSSKLIQMGQALVKEGREHNDYNIAQTGGFLITIGGVILDQEDVFIFGQLASMFSAKKLIDKLEAKNSAGNDTTKYEEFIKYLNNLRNNNGETPSS